MDAGASHKLTTVIEPQDEVRDLLRNSQLVDVRVTQISSQLVADGVPCETVSFDPTLEYSLETARYLGRYRFDVALRAANGHVAANLSCVLVAQWLLRDGYQTTPALVEKVTSTVGYLAVYPYARAILQDESLRLRVGPVVLGTVMAGEMRPELITLSGRTLGQVEPGTPADTP